MARAPFIHPLLRGDVDPVGGGAPVDRQEPRRPTCSVGEDFGRLRSGAQQKVALHSAGLGRGSPAVDGLDLRWAVGCVQVAGALSRGGRRTTARRTASTPPNTAQAAGGCCGRKRAWRVQGAVAGACQALTGETSPPRPSAHRYREECSAGIHRSSGRRRRRPPWHCPPPPPLPRRPPHHSPHRPDRRAREALSAAWRRPRQQPDEECAERRERSRPARATPSAPVSAWVSPAPWPTQRPACMWGKWGALMSRAVLLPRGCGSTFATVRRERRPAQPISARLLAAWRGAGNWRGAAGYRWI